MKRNRLFSRIRSRLNERLVRPRVRELFFRDLVEQTGNFGAVSWMGQPIWQNLFDLWTIQEVIVSLRPALLLECGTNRGGSALFYAHLFDLLGHGRVVSIDIERLHDISHPRIDFLIGDSTAPAMVEQVAEMVEDAQGPVMVILDSDHSEAHVRRELDCYAPFVTPNSYFLVQDGVIDTLSSFASARPGPLPAIKSFLNSRDDFTVDHALCDRFPVTHHPLGWLQRVA